MTPDMVVRLMRGYDEAALDVWVDGGWGVDALLGSQTRSHADLDIVLRHDHVDKFTTHMTTLGFTLYRVDGAFNWVTADPNSNQVDVHLVDLRTVRLDRFGIQVYGPGGLEYEVGCLDGRGRIGGYPVRCCSAEFQVRSHTGYELKETDYHDVMALHERFGVSLPYPYDPAGDRTEWATRMAGVS
jgi:lincosamide nucleotidyltransferase A/C/D/E